MAHSLTRCYSEPHNDQGTNDRDTTCKTDAMGDPIQRGNVAVVTGAASGIGRALVHRLGAEGMHLVATDVDDIGLETLHDELAQSGMTFVTGRCDVADPDAVDHLADVTIARFGQIDLLCNNAGIVVPTGRPLWEHDHRAWTKLIAVNLIGVANGLRAFMPLLINNPAGGWVVNVASMAGLSGIPGLGPYPSTKWAVVGLSEQLERELAELGLGELIGVTCVCPHLVATQIVDAAEGKADDVRVMTKRSSDQKSFARRLASGISPAEMADLIVEAVQERRALLAIHPKLAEIADRRRQRLLD